MPITSTLTTDRKQTYNRHYFSGGNADKGGYPDYGWNTRFWVVFERIKELQPKNVLELGCARGYVLKHLQDVGIPCKGLDVSSHCYLTRATNGVINWDVTRTPWPFRDKSFDVCFSDSLLELIPEESIPDVVREMHRVSARGIHSVDLQKRHRYLDAMRCTEKDEEWWGNSLKGETNQTFVDSLFFESGKISTLTWNKGVMKLNCGSWTTLFSHGWVNIDTADIGDRAKQLDLKFARYDLNNGIPAKNDTVSVIVASHLLDQMHPVNGLAFLKDCWRVLVAGGVIRVAVPDARRLMVRFMGKRMSFFDDINDDIAKADHQILKLFPLLGGGRPAIYDKDSLVRLMKSAGFSKVTVQPFRKSRSRHIETETFDMLPDLSLYVEGSKLTI